MKRLLIALVAAVAVSTAFARLTYKQDFENGSYDPHSDFEPSVVDEDSSELAFYNSDSPLCQAPYDFTNFGSRYLSLDTGDATLWRTNAGEAAYFDMVMQFNPSSTAPTLDAETKIAVYVALVDDAPYLFVLSGDGNGGVATNKTETTFATDTWIRLTIASNNDKFDVYAVGNLVGSYDPLPNKDATIKSVGFKGSGKLDDFVARTTNPFFDNDNAVVSVGGLSGERYASLEAALADDPKAIIELEADVVKATPLAYGESIKVRLNNHTISGLTSGSLIAVETTAFSGYKTYTASYFPRTSTADQDGSAAHPYEIADADDLIALQDAILADPATFASKSYTQTTNINMTGVGGFYGIGWFKSSDKYASLPTGATAGADTLFSGTYDGAGYTISNVTLVRHNYAGVFNNVSGTVKNLTVDNILFSDTCDEWGCAIVGNAQGSALLENLTSSGMVSWGDTANHNVAGIVVRAAGATIVRGCVNNVNINAVSKRVGGIVAFTAVASGDGVKIFSCTNNGSLFSADGTRGVGGILGCAEAGSTINSTTIAGCVDFGSEIAQGGGAGGYAGAIVGSNWNGTYTYTDGGNNTFSAQPAVAACGHVNNAIFDFAYALPVTIRDDDYLITVKQDDLAAGNTYLLLQEVESRETPIYTFTAAGTIAFDTTRFPFYSFVAAVSPLGVAGPVVDNNVYTYSAGRASVDNRAYETFSAAVAAIKAGETTEDYVTLLADASTTLNAGDVVRVKTGYYVLTVNKASNLIVTDDTDGNDITTFTAVARVAYITRGEVTTNYALLQDAVEDSILGDTINLDADSGENVLLPTGVYFAKNGHTYSGTVSAAAGNGYVVVEDAETGVYSIVNNTASTWVGDDDDFWATASNWSTGVVPGQYTTVTFPNAGRIRFAEGNGSVDVGAMVVNANVTFSENSVNYSYYPFINVCGGSISGTGTMTLERCGLKGNGTTLTVGCQVVFAGDSPTTHDCFLQNGPIVFNGTVSSTTGRLHVQTPVTFNGAVNLTNATINTAFTGVAPIFTGAVTLENGASILSYAVTYNDALTIGEGAVVSIGSSSQTYGENFTMTGSGRFIGNTVLPTGKAKEALTQSTWTGTFELLNKTITQHWWVSEYGNENSKVCFNNVTTYLYNDGNTGGSGNKNHMVAGIEIGAGGFKINGSYAQTYSWTLPALSGTGTFTVGIAGGTAGTHDKNVYLPADCSEFSGNIAFASDAANTRLVFGTTDREFKEKTICVGSDAVVGAGATWTASDEIYLDGIVKASANTSLSTVVGSGKIVYGAVPTGTHVFGEGWSGIGAIDYKEDARIDLADYVNTIAQKCSCDTVEVVEGCTMSLNNYFGADVTPTLKVSGFVVIDDGSSYTKRTVSSITGDGVLVFGTAGGKVNYAVNNVVGWNGVITNAATATLVTNIVSGTGKVVYTAATPQVFVGDDFDGVVEFATAPSYGPSISNESECEVVIGYNWSAGANLRWYGGNKSTITVTQFTGDNTYLPDDDIVSKLHIAGTFGISNGNPIMLDSSGWNHGRVIKMPALKVDGTFSMAKTSGNAWSDGAKCCYWTETLDASGEGTISVGSMFALRIDAVDFAEAPDGTDALVALSLSGEGVNMGAIYGPNGVAGEPIPVTVNGVATEQSLVYNAEKGGLVLYVPPAQVTINIPVVENTTPSVTANGEPVEIVNGQITVTDGAAIVLTYTSATHEVTNGTIEFTAADGYTVDASGVTTKVYVAYVVFQTEQGNLTVDVTNYYTTVAVAINAAKPLKYTVVLVAQPDAEDTYEISAGETINVKKGDFTFDGIIFPTGPQYNNTTTVIAGVTQYKCMTYTATVTYPGQEPIGMSGALIQILGGVYSGYVPAYAGTVVTVIDGSDATVGDAMPDVFTYDSVAHTYTLKTMVASYNNGYVTTYYPTLAYAVENVISEGTIMLLADVTLTARVEPAKSMTIDLGGYTITRTGTSGNGSVFDVKSGNVVITNGVIDCTQDDTAIVATGVYAITARSGANVTLGGLTVTVDSQAGACVYPFDGAQVTILSGTYANTTQSDYQYKAGWRGMAVNQANVATQLITIYGGSFKQVDPTLGDDSWASAGNGFLAAGYAATWNPSTGYYDVAKSGIDPERGTEVSVDTTKTPEEQAAEAQSKADAMDVTGAEAAGVDQTTWNSYFTKTAEKVNDTWVAKAELNPAVVLPVDGAEETPLTDMLESVAAMAIDTTKETSASVPTKAGLYYWIEGATEVGAASYTPGKAELGDGTTKELGRPTLTGENGKAFFKVCVGVAAPVKD